MRFTNARVLTEDFTFQEIDFSVREGKFCCVGTDCAERETKVSLEGLTVLPGLIDLHLHGSAGFDFSNPFHNGAAGGANGLADMAGYLAAHGVTGFTPATMTLSYEQISGSIALAREFAAAQAAGGSLADGAARLQGIYMEGPFFSKAKKGAQDERYIHDPDIAQAKKFFAESGGLLKIISIAPETEGAEDFIREMSGQIRIALGHTACDYTCAKSAFDAGARQATHLYNGMKDPQHREPNLPGAAADDPRVMVELIADGNHIDPCIIRATFKLFGAERVILISDSLAACGAGDRVCTCGVLPVKSDGNVARLEDGTMAGSITDLFGCMKRAVSFGVPTEDAVRAASLNPARALGLDQSLGSIAEGKTADFVVCDDDLEVLNVFIGGQAHRG